MAEVLPRHYIYGIIVFTLIIVGGITIISSLNEKNPNFADTNKFEDFEKAFNKSNDITTEVSNIQSAIEDAQVDKSTYGTLTALIDAGWASFKAMFSGLAFMGTAMLATSTVFGIPAWIPSLVILFAIILIAFAILTAIFQREI